MQKPVLIAEARTTRELMPGADLDAALKSGSYVVVTRPKSVRKGTKAQQQFRDARLVAGDKEIRVYLPRAVYDLMVSLTLPGETQAKLIERSINKLADDSQSQGQK